MAIDDLIDGATLVKASQAISQEVEIDTLYRRVIPLVLENAGPTTAWLAVLVGTRVEVVATGTTDGPVLLGTEASGYPIPDTFGSI